MIKIDLQDLGGNTHGFVIFNGKYAYTTSRSIAALFNLDTDTYNDILIKKVIKHSFYENSNFSSFPYFETDSDKNIVFYLHGIDERTYFERFKEVFAKQLTIAALG